MIFTDYLTKYAFWGHCDIDVIFGQIRQFISEKMLNYYDVITSFPKEIEVRPLAGHFTIYRNNQICNHLYSRNPMYKEIFQLERYTGYDEGKMAWTVTRAVEAGQIKALWPERSVLRIAESTNKLETNRFFWKEGRLYDRGEEIMYVHFMKWKGWLQKCYFGYKDNPKSFYISYSHIGPKFSLPPLRVLAGRLKRALLISGSKAATVNRFTK
jgi:hypothetical protein